MTIMKYIRKTITTYDKQATHVHNALHADSKKYLTTAKNMDKQNVTEHCSNA